MFMDRLLLITILCKEIWISHTEIQNGKFDLIT